MSVKSRSTKSNFKVVLDTQSFRKPSRDQHSLVAYTLLTFIVVLALYFLTEDWKGFTAPEEVDLGSLRVIRRVGGRRKRDRTRQDPDD